MSSETKIICGIILLTIPGIQYGGYFLLTVLKQPAKLGLTDFQKSMFRAGHAHAGVIVILSLIGELLADGATLGPLAHWFVRAGLPLSAILISGGFFAGAAGKGRTTPNGWIGILYLGIAILAAALILLGVGLLRAS